MSNGRIPDEVIEAVLKHHDIVDVVGKYVHLSKQGHYMKGLCPFHSEKTPSFTVTPEKQIFYCYGCHAGGNAIHFIMNIESLPFGEAVRQLAEEAHIPIGSEQAPAEQTEQQKEMEALLQAYDFTAKLYHHFLITTQEGRSALQYLRSRGISDKLIEKFQIGCALPKRDMLVQFLEKRQYTLPLMDKGGLISSKENGGYADKFRDRVIFPIRNAKGRVVAFAGRAMENVQPKYLNSPESMLFSKSRTLYHFHDARAAIRKQRQGVLFEGYVDLIKAWEAGVVNGVATMGTALTEEHARILRQNAEQIIVCYDGDDAGQAAAYKSIPILEKAGLGVKIAVIPNGMDPDEYISSNGSERFVRDILEGALSVVSFKLLYTRRNFNMQDIDARRRYINTAVRLIAELPSPIDREHYIKELSVEFSYSMDAIRQQLNESRQEFLKKQQNGDNNGHSWNNVRNDGPHIEKLSVKYDAVQVAESLLLYAMMNDADHAEYVRSRLGDQFTIEVNAALAAYLYAFYAKGSAADPTHFLAVLQDDALINRASEILHSDFFKAVTPDAIEDSVSIVLQNGHQRTRLEQLRSELKNAVRSGDPSTAARIGIEIIALEKQLKSS